MCVRIVVGNGFGFRIVVSVGGSRTLGIRCRSFCRVGIGVMEWSRGSVGLGGGGGVLGKDRLERVYLCTCRYYYYFRNYGKVNMAEF